MYLYKIKGEKGTKVKVNWYQTIGKKEKVQLGGTALK